MKNFKCILTDCDWRYNFPNVPNKRICSKCKKREGLNLVTLQWTNIFYDSRSDDELIDKWFKI